MTCYKADFVWESDVTRENYQITKITSSTLDIINIYKSSGSNNSSFMDDLRTLICIEQSVLIIGDFNICYKSDPSNLVFEELRKLGFQQLVKSTTHTEGGVIDLVFFLACKESHPYNVRQTPQFFTDHDLIEIYKGKKHVM